jgi:thiamine-phosphate pyrophosphorylase
MNKPLVRMPRRGLYAITGPATGAILHAEVEAVLKGGAVLVQYRQKGGRGPERLADATRLVALTRRYGVPLLINDDVDLAAACGAAGIHLGKDDGSLTVARRRLGAEAIIGASCYDSASRAAAAVEEGADYLAFGAFFPSPTKPQARQAALALLTVARVRFGLPVVAIGGITPANGGPLLAAGADLLAVVSGLQGIPDPEGAAAAYAALFRSLEAP